MITVISLYSRLARQQKVTHSHSGGSLSDVCASPATNGGGNVSSSPNLLSPGGSMDRSRSPSPHSLAPGQYKIPHVRIMPFNKFFFFFFFFFFFEKIGNHLSPFASVVQMWPDNSEHLS